eukprot:4886273-Pyramimonas_sp.AAC.1
MTRVHSEVCDLSGACATRETRLRAQFFTSLGAHGPLAQQVLAIFQACVARPSRFNGCWFCDVLGSPS